MTLPLDFEDTGEVGALVAMMLGLEFLIGATSPFLLGRSVTPRARSMLCSGVSAGF
jgi:hypothetical protein